MKKLLASDLDGTLIFDGKLSEENKQSILKLKEKGYYFGVSTGRPYNGVSFLKDHDINPDFYVLLNGALVINKDNKVLKHEVIPYEVIKSIYEKYNFCNLLGLDSGYETTILKGISKYCWGSTKFASIDEIKNEKHSLISIDFSNRELEEVDSICYDINNEFSNYIVAYRNSYFIDVVPKGCSKGDGVSLIIKDLNINKENLYVIGDSYNDISMFRESENSFTFNNVEEKIKDHTNYVVDSVSECIGKYMLGDLGEV